MLAWSQFLQMGGSAGGWTFGFLGPLMELLGMAATVFAPSGFLATGMTAAGDSNRDEGAMETIRRRYARGDIDETRFGECPKTRGLVPTVPWTMSKTKTRPGRTHRGKTR